jgi:ankyrin repeat protein
MQMNSNDPSTKSTQSKPVPMGKADYALFEALQSDDIDEMRRSIQKGANVNCSDQTFITPLISAVFANKPTLVDLLLTSGAQPNMSDPDTGNSPLAFASHMGADPDIFFSLIQAGADIDAPNFGGISTRELILSQNSAHPRLIEAARQGSARQSLRAKSAAPSIDGPLPKFVEPGKAWSKAEQQQVAEGIGSGRSVDMAKAIGQLASAAAAKRLSDLQWSELTEAIEAGLAKAGMTRQQMAESLNKHAPEACAAYLFNAEKADEKNGDDCSDVGGVLDMACAHGNFAQIRFWSMACGPDWNPDGMSPPLSWSVHGKQAQAAQLLLQMGANPNLTAAADGESNQFDVSQDAPLHLAIGAGQFDIALMLLRSGALATGTDRDNLQTLRESIDETTRQATLAALAKNIASPDMEVSARGVGALGALCACGWTRDGDFEPWIKLAQSAKERFGPDYAELCQRDLESIAHLEVEFNVALEKRGAVKTYAGSIMDRAAATGSLFTLEFLAVSAGANWNPDGGDRPIDWASNVGDSDAVEILAKHHAVLDADPADADGKAAPPLARAAAGGWREAASRLLLLGAEPAALQDGESHQTQELLGAAGLAHIEQAARDAIQSASPEQAYFGLRQIWNLAKAGWIGDWDLNLDALDKIGAGALTAKNAQGITQAGSALLLEGGYLMTPAAAEHPLGGDVNFFSRLASLGDSAASRFMARSLGPNFRHPQDNGAALANAIAMRKTETARALISSGASLDGEPDLLGLAARGNDAASFLMLASLGAKPNRLGAAELDAIRPALLAKASQQALGSVIASLPPDESGFDSLLADGSMPSSLMANLIRSGEKERFWINREKIDWTRDASTLIESAMAEGEEGLAAYAKFRRGLAADNIDAANVAVSGAPALLASLSKRGLVDEAIMAALGAGRSSLLKTMTEARWPMESTMREHAAAALLVAAGAKDASMFEMLLPMAPADAMLADEAQSTIAKAAWKLGGAALLARFDEQIGGMSPKAIDSCRELFVGSDGEKAFAQITLAGLEREGARSRAIDKQSERQARRHAYFSLATGHWSSLGDEQKLSAALAIASWNEPGFWENAEKTLANAGPADRSRAKADGSEAFFTYCFSDRSIVRAVFGKVKEELTAPLAAAAQMAAATRDDPELASMATVDAGCPCSERALLLSARLGHRATLDALLSRADGGAMKGMLSRALIAPGDELLRPVTPGYDMPDWACLRLASAGASFAPKDLEGAGMAQIAKLAKLAADGSISVERERAFSTLALRGALPAESWIPKADILRREPNLLEYASNADKNNADLVIAAVSVDGMALRHAGPVAKATVSVALAAAKQSADAFHCIHPALIQAFSLRQDNTVATLSKAADDMQSINPLKMFAKKSAVQGERAALEQAKAEMESAQRARSLDFLPFERSIADAKLANQDRAQAEMTLSFARAVRQSFEQGGKASNLDIADLRRLVEKNLPDLINGYSSTERSTRDAYDPSTRSTPNQMLRSGLRDAMTTMQNVAARLDDGARVALRGEAIVLESKATSADLLLGRRKEESAQTQAEVEGQAPADHIALSAFSGAVDSAASAIDATQPDSSPSFTRKAKL